MSLRRHRTRLTLIYSLCALGLAWQYPAWLSSWNLNLAWLQLTDSSGNERALKSGRVEGQFRQVLRIRRDCPGAWMGLGRLAVLREDPEGAQAAFRQVLAIDASHPAANLELARMRWSERRFKEAAAHYLAAGDVYALVRVGDVLAGSQPKEALRLYKEAIALHPGIRVPHSQLGKLLLKEGRQDEALIEFKRALDADPGYGWSWYHLASTCLADGRPEECLDWIRSARRRLISDPELRAALKRLEARARQTLPGDGARREIF